jgi:hypothetical protein
MERRSGQESGRKEPPMKWSEWKTLTREEQVKAFETYKKAIKCGNT